MCSTQLNKNILHNQNQYIDTINNLHKELFKVSPKLNKITKLQVSILKLQRILIDANKESIETYVHTFKENILDDSILLEELQKIAHITDSTENIKDSLKTHSLNELRTKFITDHEEFQHKKGSDFLKIWQKSENLNVQMSDAFDILNDIIIPKLGKSTLIELTQRQSILDQQIEDIFFTLDSLMAQSKTMISYRYKDEH